MAAMFTCCFGCCGEGGPGHIPLKEMPTVQLDTHHMGEDAFMGLRWLFKSPNTNKRDIHALLQLANQVAALVFIIYLRLTYYCSSSEVDRCQSYIILFK